MPVVDLKLPHHAYRIHVERDLLSSPELGRIVRYLAPHSQAAVIYDSQVPERFRSAAGRSLEASGYAVRFIAVPAGEANKTLATVAGLYEQLIAARLERRSPILALGGGVVGDTAGFVAATYLRGVPFFQCPTTLLAMVDASVGGKVGVNLPQGKNLVGAFHQPQAVLIDTETLSTLPERELRCGLAECIKHGLIRSQEKFHWLEGNVDRVLKLDSQALVDLVEWNVAIKATVVMADEKEAGERAHLNFGHTFGHAIEAATEYGTFHHGEAVALGMVAAAFLAQSTGRCGPEVLPRLTQLIQRAGLPTREPNLPDTAVLMQAMTIDKKVAQGKIRFVLPTRIGEVTIVNDVPARAVEHAWEHVRG